MKTRLITLLSTGMMLTSAVTLAHIQAADVSDTDTNVNTLPEWIPTSFDEALGFRNTYGSTHIDKNVKNNDTLCIVFSESLQKEYKINNGNDDLDEIYHKSFTDDSSQIRYEVVAYTVFHQNAGLCSFDIELVDANDKYVAGYSFGSYGVGYIVEDDIYSWLPDCEVEYEEYIKKNGEVSIKDNYVVFCLGSDAGAVNGWYVDSINYDDSLIEYCCTSSCIKEKSVPVDGGAVKEVVAYQFKKEGCATLSYIYVPKYNVYRPEDIEKRLTADCIAIDDAKTVLMKGNVRYTFKDYDTGNVLKLPNSSVKMDVSPTIGYKTDVEGVYMYADTMVTADINPYIWRNNEEKTPDIFNVELNEEAMPYGYKLPDDYKSITIYENGSYDVEFKLKQDEKSLAPNTVRITLYDKDTGELIPEDMLGLHPFTLCTDIRFKDPSDPERWMMTGPVFFVQSNPFVCKDNLASLYKSADYFSIGAPYEHEIKAYDNNSMDIILKIKFESYGDINGDGGFNIADLVMLEKWLLTGKGDEYKIWREADFCADGKIDVFDLCMMRRKLIEKVNNTYTDFETKYIFTKELNGYAGYPQRNLIRNSDELEDYIDSKKDSLDLSEFKEASKNYNDEWFKDHKLIVISIESTENTIHKVTGIVKGMKDKYTNEPNDYVQIECQVPVDGTWGKLITHPQILIELDNSFDINEFFDFEFINTIVDDEN